MPRENNRRQRRFLSAAPSCLESEVPLETRQTGRRRPRDGGAMQISCPRCICKLERPPSTATSWSTLPNSRPLTGLARGLAYRRSYWSALRVLLRVSLVQRINIHGAINLGPKLQRKDSGHACQRAGIPSETHQASVSGACVGCPGPPWTGAAAFNSAIPSQSMPSAPSFGDVRSAYGRNPGGRRVSSP